tara:strand:- start:400 stop:1953 length:1554 start_codon:yes stop_codon:yes gene_type:complete
MSQASAQRIIQMYSNANTERINSALQIAFQEAQSIQLSEQATRQLLQETLKAEQVALNSYIKTLQSARTAQRRGQFDLAKANINNFNRNLAAYSNDMDQYQREVSRLASKNQDVATKGEEVSQDIYSAEANSIDDFASAIDNVGRLISSGASDAQVIAMLTTEDFAGKLRMTDIKFSDDKYQDFGKTSTKDFKMSDLVESLFSQIAQRAGVDVADVENGVVARYMFDPNLAGGKGGTLRSLDYKNAQVREQARQSYVTDYVNVNGKKPTMKRPTAPTEQVIATQSAVEKQLLADAQPVLDALSTTDDTPFRITESERRNISQAAFGAYNELKNAYRINPNVVNVDQAVLLDDIALERAMRVNQLRAQATAPMAKPRSTEATLARASEIAEPRRAEQGREAMAQRPAYEQKYFASERKALELSDQDDQTVRAMGTPETYGVTKWKEVWNGEQMSSDYGSIVSDIEQQFPNPTDQLKALSAFNSRAMSLQRAKSPILVDGGKLSDDYKAALEAMTPKEL